MDESVECFELAQVHLDTAIDLYYNHNYLCALTLAAASEEVLGKILEYSTDKKSIHRVLIDTLLKENPEMTESKISSVLTQSRDMLKHFKPIEGQSLRPVDDSTFFIFKAIENYIRLRDAVTSNMQRFKNDEDVKKIIMNYFSA